MAQANRRKIVSRS